MRIYKNSLYPYDAYSLAFDERKCIDLLKEKMGVIPDWFGLMYVDETKMFGCDYCIKADGRNYLVSLTRGTVRHISACTGGGHYILQDDGSENIYDKKGNLIYKIEEGRRYYANL